MPPYAVEAGGQRPAGRRTPWAPLLVGAAMLSMAAAAAVATVLLPPSGVDPEVLMLQPEQQRVRAVATSQKVALPPARCRCLVPPAVM